MKLNLPNKLTLLRVILVPLFALFMMLPQIAGSLILPRILAGALFLICALTDYFDGMLARKHDQITDLGKFLDPIADKFMIITAMMALCASEAYAYLRLWAFIAGAIVVLRELAVTSVRLLMAGRSTVIAAAWPGKCKTVTQIVFVACAILEPVIFPMSPHILTYASLAAMTAMTIYSGADYLRKYLPLLKK